MAANLLGVVTGGVLVDLLGLVPDLALRLGTKAGQLGQAVEARHDHVQAECDLDQEYKDALQHLSMPEQSCSHDEGRESREQVALFEGPAYSDSLFFHNALPCFLVQVWQDGGRPGRGPAALGRECPYWTAEVFMEVFMASVFSAALLWVTVPATSSLPMDSAGVQ